MESMMSATPWRVLILDRDPDDPVWIIATITLPTDVRPAHLDLNGRYTDWPQVTAWARAQTGEPVALVPLHDALAWHVDGRRSR